jgi:hypothetical protein
MYVLHSSYPNNNFGSFQWKKLKGEKKKGIVGGLYSLTGTRGTGSSCQQPGRRRPVVRRHNVVIRTDFMMAQK